MKNLLNVLFILLFISSCSDTDNSTFPEINDEEENNTEKIIPLKLEIEDTRKNIFDYAVFGLFPNDYFIMFSLFDIYDAKNGADCYSKNGDAVTVPTWQS